MFLVGVGVASVISSVALMPWIVIIVLASGLAFFPRRFYVVLFVSISMFSLGVWRFSSVNRPVEIEGYASQYVELTGYVDGEFRSTNNGGQFYFQTRTMDENLIDARVLVRTERWPEYEIGTPLSISGTLELPWEGYDFDYRAYLKKDGVRVLMQQPNIQTREELPLALSSFVSVSVRSGLTALRDGMRTNIQAGVSEPASAYLNGIILGVREDLPTEVSEAFSRTGTTHILAISGYNIAIVAQGLMLLCLHIMDRRRSVWLAIIGISLFALLTGASASVVRAAIMGSIVLVAQAWGRNIHALNLILVAAVAMVIYNPYVLIQDIGFQLSFAAVLGLVYVSPWLENTWSAPARFKGVWSMTVATGAANIATLPLILVHFGALPVYSLPANIMILPLVPYAMAWGTISGVLGWVWPTIANIVAFPAWALATWQLAVVQWFGRLPWASIAIPLTWNMAFVFYVVFVLVYMRYGNRRGHNTVT